MLTRIPTGSTGGKELKRLVRLEERGRMDLYSGGEGINGPLLLSQGLNCFHWDRQDEPAARTHSGWAVGLQFPPWPHGGAADPPYLTEPLSGESGRAVGEGVGAGVGVSPGALQPERRCSLCGLR